MTESHIRIYNKYCRLPEFLQFTLTTEFSLLLFLLANITRNVTGNNNPVGAWRIYNDFFKKGFLCVSYSQNDMAKYFGFMKNGGEPNGATISRLIKKLEQMGLLKIHKIKTPGGLRNVYELGQYSGQFGNEDYSEKLYFDQYFQMRMEIYKLQKAKQKQEQIIERNAPGFISEMNCQIRDLENELIKLNDRAIDSFR